MVLANEQIEHGCCWRCHGKVRGRIEAPADVDEKAAKEIALSDENVLRQITDRKIQKVFYVKGRLINFVTT